jgi:hypothetical protein
MNDLLRSGLIAGGFTLFLVLLFIISYWAFRGFLPGSKVVEQPLPSPNDIDGSTAIFKLFYVDWCPYSKEAFDKMEEFKKIVDNYTYGGKHVKIEFMNCETHKDECALYKIEAYPTYKLETTVNMYEYIGPASIPTYRTFLTDALGAEESIADND